VETPDQVRLKADATYCPGHVRYTRHVFPANADRILASLRPSDVVVDIGGWAQPFTRANYVVDLMPYETRGVFGRIGPEQEHFSKGTWLHHDLCTDPLPFADKSVDFIICSHTLEDVRDPIRICREMTRVAKHGYIETPSRRMETIRNLEHRGYPGYYHHHWLVEMENGAVTFRFKTWLMCASWRYTFPRSYLRDLRPEDRVTWLFWDDSFTYREIVQLGEDNVAAELEAFVRAHRPYPAWRYGLERFRPDLRKRVKRALKGTTRFRGVADRLLGRQIHVADEERFWKDIPDHESK
jgi:SAM-dependent methyltransferase